MKRIFGEPAFIYGMTVGLAAAILGAFLLITEAFTFGLLGVFVIGAIFIFGACFGYFITRYAKQSAADKAGNLLPSLGSTWLDINWDLNRLQTQQLNNEEATEQNTKHRESLNTALGALYQRISSMYLRMLAFGSLFTMIGLLISFAVFWATFLQVSRLEEQIETTKTAKQIDIALSIASNHQFLVNNFINEISKTSAGAAALSLSDRQYRQLEATLRQLKPYTGIDTSTSELSKVAHSPEQTYLLQYLLANEVRLPANKISLSKLTAHKLDAQFSDLAKANFAGSDLQKSSFYKAILTHVNCANCQLNNVRFIAASLNGVNFSGADLSQTDFSGADLSNANLNNANLNGANFNSVDGWQAISNIAGANITGIQNAPDGFVEWALAAGAVVQEN